MTIVESAVSKALDRGGSAERHIGRSMVGWGQEWSDKLAMPRSALKCHWPRDAVRYTYFGVARFWRSFTGGMWRVAVTVALG